MEHMAAWMLNLRPSEAPYIKLPCCFISTRANISICNCASCSNITALSLCFAIYELKISGPHKSKQVTVGLLFPLTSKSLSIWIQTHIMSLCRWERQASFWSHFLIIQIRFVYCHHVHNSAQSIISDSKPWKSKIFLHSGQSQRLVSISSRTDSDVNVCYLNGAKAASYILMWQIELESVSLRKHVRMLQLRAIVLRRTRGRTLSDGVLFFS